jgi:hypothetical protein
MRRVRKEMRGGQSQKTESGTEVSEGTRIEERKK